LYPASAKADHEIRKSVWCVCSIYLVTVFFCLQ
jgi:hypothetical protein